MGSTSPSSENSKGAMEEESENIVNPLFKKPVFTITRQNKLSKSLSVESDEPSSKPSVSSGNYNRKEKSLAELSKRFLTLFGRVNECVISLDVVTKQLEVERRRVYDIINILESLGVVYRKSKNNYQWNGLDPVRETIQKLESNKNVEIKQEEVCEEGETTSDEEDIVGQRLAHRKEQSLAYLAGSFIKLFFSWKGVIPLEEAAWRLSPKDTNDHKIKTKIRRLYDIANVFSSLGLIKKVNADGDSRKPAFMWTGTEGLNEFINELHNGPAVSLKKVNSADAVIEKPLKKLKSDMKKKTEEAKVKLEEVRKGETSVDLLTNILNALMTAGQPEPERTRSAPEGQTTSERKQSRGIILQQNTESLNGKRAAPLQNITNLEVRTEKKKKIALDEGRE